MSDSHKMHITQKQQHMPKRVLTAASLHACIRDETANLCMHSGNLQQNADLHSGITHLFQLSLLDFQALILTGSPLTGQELTISTLASTEGKGLGLRVSEQHKLFLYWISLSRYRETQSTPKQRAFQTPKPETIPKALRMAQVSLNARKFRPAFTKAPRSLWQRDSRT